MGWSIENISNTVKISKEVTTALMAIDSAQDYWDDVDCVTSSRGYLFFNQDHMEHMDYVGDPEVLQVLQDHKVNGIITFGSLEGDNAGSYWGYEFDGEGNMFPLEGIITFRRAE